MMAPTVTVYDVQRRNLPYIRQIKIIIIKKPRQKTCASQEPGGSRTLPCKASKQKQRYYFFHQLDGPNVPLSGSVLCGTPTKSSVLVYTVFPHHLCMLFSPILPLFGYCSVKYTISRPTAYPASNPADNTSKGLRAMYQKKNRAS
jgi:hypothetical protein